MKDCKLHSFCILFILPTTVVMRKGSLSSKKSGLAIRLGFHIPYSEIEITMTGKNTHIILTLFE